jgi:hypothetical protein
VWKHHQACGNIHQACGNIIERGETLVSRVETPIKRGETSSSVGKRGGAPRRAGLSERGDAGRGGGAWGCFGVIPVRLCKNKKIFFYFLFSKKSFEILKSFLENLYPLKKY